MGRATFNIPLKEMSMGFDFSNWQRCEDLPYLIEAKKRIRMSKKRRKLFEDVIKLHLENLFKFFTFFPHFIIAFDKPFDF